MNKFLGKPVIDTNKSDFYNETKYYEDMRVVFLAHFFEKRKEEVEVISQMRGMFKYYYRKTGFIRNLVAIFILFLAIFQKPAWCAKMGDQITPDCRQAADGRTFFIFAPFFLDGTQVTVMVFSLMYFLLGFQALKIHFSEAVVRNEMIKFNILLFFFCSSLLINIFEGLGVVERSGLSTVCNLLFVFFYFKTVIKALKYFIKMISFSWEVLLLWFVNVFVFALIARLAFENVDIGSPSFFQGYSFSSFTDSVNSIFGLMFLSGFPDIMVDAHAKNPLSILIFVPFLIFSSILISYSITGNYYFHFKMCYIENLNQQHSRYPDFRTKVVPLLKEKFLNPEQAKSSMKALAQQIKRQEVEGVKLDNADEGKKATLEKLRRTVRKIKMMRMFQQKTPQNSFRNTYINARRSFAFKVVDFVLSAYSIALPLISLSKNQNLAISENVQASELLGTIFLVDLIIYAKFATKDPFWSFLKIVDLISSVGMILFSHIMYLFPLDFRTDNLIASNFFFTVWAFANIAKLFRIHKIVLNSIDYKVIIKTLLHIMPIIVEFLVIYALFVVTFASIGFTILGGSYNNLMLERYQQMTGGELEAVYSFNDLLGSLVGISFFNLGGEFLDIGLPAVVALSQYHSSSLINILMTMFFYIYIIISELMVINLIIGLTMDFLMAYGDNNAALIKSNRQYTSNTNIIDRFLGLKTFENQDSKEGEEEKKSSKDEGSIKAAQKPKIQVVNPEMSMELSKDFESVDAE